MASVVRQRFEDRARELADCASFTVVPEDKYTETLRLVPHDTRALGVHLHRWTGEPGHDFEISHDHPGAIPLEEPSDASDVDYMIDLAVEGRIRVFLGKRDNAMIETRSADGNVTNSYYNLGPWWIPYLRSRWIRRAETITFVPYRS